MNLVLRVETNIIEYCSVAISGLGIGSVVSARAIHFPLDGVVAKFCTEEVGIWERREKRKSLVGGGAHVLCRLGKMRPSMVDLDRI